MSANESEKVEDSVPEEEIKLGLDGQSVDWYLQKLVALVNGSQLEFGVTLYVNGSVVSGRLIGGKKYFEEFAKEFTGAYPGSSESKESIRAAFASNGDIYDREEGDGEDLPPPQFIHLADARCFSGGGSAIPNRGVLWRGKINSVSGFSLGQLSPE